ncbi:arginine--tRNA ligase [Frigoriglobus tundricola]|uniref:Arginine--tRNA ligase n=1 Tax=Frigoriglobus tundricola TaxID=2774151 RepID=A0A6M5Z052_9BACT|nr:arginine--tRNA ligase [Frigoriglobus tundricola]QJW99528.1 Arginyl-tRNA synthetase [Frigoriglobus tundricola]
MNLLTQVRALFEPAITALAPDKAKVPDYLNAIKPSSNADNGDYQANCAMALGKALGQKPQDVAKALVAHLPANDLLEEPTVAGPGFINLRLKSDFLAKAVQSIATDPKLGVAPAAEPKTFVIDLSGPNVAKPLHVGHLRSTIIGDALVRILRFLGHTVISDNHLGDWGTQFGMLIYGYRTFLDKKKYGGSNEDKVRELARLYVLVRQVAGTIDIISRGFTHFRDEGAFQANPVAELTRVYVNGLKRASAPDDDDDEGGAAGPPASNPVADGFRQETAKLHEGDAENLKLWREFMPPCMEEIHKVYKKLEVIPFDHEHGESFYQPMLAGVVESLRSAGVSEEGDGGSVIIRFGPENVALIRKRDRAFTYTTTDLATIKYRIETFKPDAMLYVVDFRQAQHFANLFEASRRWGYEGVELNHVKFGSVLNKDGKPLKTREGGTTELTTLLDRATELGGALFEMTYWQRKANGHDVPDWKEYTEDEKANIASAVGIGAVKYADLSQNRTTDYKFDFAKMLATDGNTATYMQYAYARCRAIFRKGDIDEARFRANPPAVAITHPAERTLALQLLRFPEAVEAAAADYLPHLITAYLWDLAKCFSGFFEGCPVLKAETPELKESRLLLVDLVGRVIKQALDLLGIRVVERM